MPTALLLALAMLGQAPAPRPKADRDADPLALYRGMELDDLDREIQRLHDGVIQKKAHLASSQRLAERGIMSRMDLATEMTALRMDEAREAETTAYRDLKRYERDLAERGATPDPSRAYALLSEWVKHQEAIAQVDADYREYIVKQSRSLYQRRAISRQELEDDELDYTMSLASVALGRSRRARVAMDMAAAKDEKARDPAEIARLRVEYLKAQVRYFELSSDLAHRRLDLARDRSRRGLLPANELDLFQKGADDADADLDDARKQLEAAAPPASSPPRSS